MEHFRKICVNEPEFKDIIDELLKIEWDNSVADELREKDNVGWYIENNDYILYQLSLRRNNIYKRILKKEGYYAKDNKYVIQKKLSSKDNKKIKEIELRKDNILSLIKESKRQDNNIDEEKKEELKKLKEKIENELLDELIKHNNVYSIYVKHSSKNINRVLLRMLKKNNWLKTYILYVYIIY